ncbi:MAG: hypothetical protein FWF12_00490 [Betaproteobacteria bacterium]|nr:hypothetical protein [Betaproteobacteria bacterium]
MSYEEVMRMPIRTFWFMNSNIERIQAQKDMRSLTVAVCGQGGETAQQFHERLIVEAGTVVRLKFDPMRNAHRDEAGFSALRDMAKQQ